MLITARSGGSRETPARVTRSSGRNERGRGAPVDTETSPRDDGLGFRLVQGTWGRTSRRQLRATCCSCWGSRATSSRARCTDSRAGLRPEPMAPRPEAKVEHEGVSSASPGRDAVLPNLSNSPSCAPPRKASHSSCVNLRTGPSGSLLLRTPTESPGSSATSTQLPLEKLRELLTQTAFIRSRPSSPGCYRKPGQVSGCLAALPAGAGSASYHAAHSYMPSQSSDHHIMFDKIEPKFG
jgi:hypothetical protein